MNEIGVLTSNTDRRFAILMTAIEDFMKAYAQERQHLLNLVQINQKFTEKQIEKPILEKKTPSKKKKKPKKEVERKNVDEKPESNQEEGS